MPRVLSRRRLRGGVAATRTSGTRPQGRAACGLLGEPLRLTRDLARHNGDDPQRPAECPLTLVAPLVQQRLDLHRELVRGGCSLSGSARVETVPQTLEARVERLEQRHTELEQRSSAGRAQSGRCETRPPPRRRNRRAPAWPQAPKHEARRASPARASTSAGSGSPRGGAPWPGARDRDPRTPAGTRASPVGNSPGRWPPRSTRPPGSWRPCPARRSTGARRRPRSAPPSGSRCRR